jgi:hypothetical protein
MHVLCFDEESELDLEIKVNEALKDYQDHEIVDIKYCISTTYDEREQIYCFSCMIIFKN